MKKYLIIVASILIVITSSCSDFLKETDKDKLVPSTTDHYAAVLLGEMEFFNTFMNIDYMTDNMDEYSYSLSSGRKNIKSVYTWQREIEYNEDNKKISTNEAWKDIYKKVTVANYILEFIDDAKGTEAEKASIKGEAYFLRAYFYYFLTNLYGKPYNKENAKNELGVILRLDCGIQQVYNRATVTECYAQIINDLIEARRLIVESSITNSKWHPSVEACDLLLSRVYLYTEQWDKVIEHSSNVINKVPLSMMTKNGKYITNEREELIYTTSRRIAIPMDVFEKNWRVSDELISLYDKEKDYRFEAYFKRIMGQIGMVYGARKYSWDYSELGMMNMRSSEAYLNRAEAYANINEEGKAMADLNTLRKKRIHQYENEAVTDKTQIISKILLERRKELCFDESHRWFDLRRMKNRPEIIHTYTLTDESGNVSGVERFTLLSDDLNYTLPIPLEERQNNPIIRNNERYEKLPLI